ncbi:MAG: cytochrome c [Congregibacter sp.]
MALALSVASALGTGATAAQNVEIKSPSNYQPNHALAAQLARGEYLALAGNCASCHTTDSDGFMAGGLAFTTPFGLIYSTNITPDVNHGIGSWSEADFARSLRHGERPDGEHLYPVFPYTAFTKMRDEDIRDLYAYFQSLTPIARPNQDNELQFPFQYRSLLTVWKTLFLEDGPYQPDVDQSASWNRGAYLVEGLTHCSACHSPRNPLGAEDRSRLMHGGEYVDRVPGGLLRPWSAPGLTSSAAGLGAWTEDDLHAYLKTGRNGFLESFGPMNEVIMNSTRFLTDSDIDAMTVYLKSLPAAPQPEHSEPSGLEMGRGRTVYNLHCGTCHLPTGAGDPEMGPRLDAGSLVVQAEDPASMLNVILYGPETAHQGVDSQWRKPMEEFQYILDDEEVAAVATFVRNSWSNRAGSVSVEQVRRQR